MTKLLSVVLSFAILFSSVAPSWAQARSPKRRSSAPLEDLAFKLRTLSAPMPLKAAGTKYGTYLRKALKRKRNPWDYHLKVKSIYEPFGREYMKTHGLHDMWDPYMTVTYLDSKGKVLGTERMLITQWMCEERDYREYIKNGGQMDEDFTFELNYLLKAKDSNAKEEGTVRINWKSADMELNCSMKSCETDIKSQMEKSILVSAFKKMIDKLLEGIGKGLRNVKEWDSLEKEVKEAVAYLMNQGTAAERYSAFKKIYRKEIEEEINAAAEEITDANDEETAKTIEEIKTTLLEAEMMEEKVHAAYEQLEKQSQEEGLRYLPGTTYLKDLSHRVVTSPSPVKLVQKGLPIFAAFGAIEEADKKKAAEILRTDLLNQSTHCIVLVNEAMDETACASALQDISGLAVLGEKGGDKSEDAKAIYQFLDKGYGYPSPLGAYIIMASIPALNELKAGGYILDVMDKAKKKTVAFKFLKGKVMQGTDGSDQAISPYMAGTWALGLEGSLYQTEDGEIRSAWTDAGAYLGKAAAEGDITASWVIDVHARETIGFEPHVRWRRGVSFSFPSFSAGVLEGGSYKQIVEILKEKEGYDYVEQLKDNSGGSWRDYLFFALYDHNKIDLEAKAWNDVNNRLVDEWNKDPNHARLSASVTMENDGSMSVEQSAWQDMVKLDELPKSLQEQVKCSFILADAMNKILIMKEILDWIMIIDGVASVAAWGWRKAFSIQVARTGKMGVNVKPYNIKGMHKLLRAHASEKAAYYAQYGQDLVAQGERLAEIGNTAAAESAFAQAEIMAEKATRMTPFMGIDRGSVIKRQVTRARQGVNVSKTMNSIRTTASEANELIARGNISDAGTRLQKLQTEVSSMQKAGVGKGKAYTKSQFKQAQQLLKETEKGYAQANVDHAAQGATRVKEAFASGNYNAAFESLQSLRSQVATMKKAGVGKNKMYSKEQYQQARTALSDAESVFSKELETARDNLLTKARLEGKRYVEVPQYDKTSNQIVMTWEEVSPVSPGFKPTLKNSVAEWLQEKRLSVLIGFEDFRSSLQTIINKPLDFTKNTAVALSLNIAPISADAAALTQNTTRSLVVNEYAAEASAVTKGVTPVRTTEASGFTMGGKSANNLTSQPLQTGYSDIPPFSPVAVNSENWRFIHQGNFFKNSLLPLTFEERAKQVLQATFPQFVKEYQRDLSRWHALNARYTAADGVTNTPVLWDSREAFTSYQQQLNAWLYRSGSLYQAQNPWPAANWLNDVKNSFSIVWKEFNLKRHQNPDYLEYINSSEASSSPSVESGAAPASALASSSSGILYSGVPLFVWLKQIKNITKKIVRFFSREKSLPKESTEPGKNNIIYVNDKKVTYRYRRVVHEGGAIRILKNDEEAPKGLKVYLLAEKYNFTPAATDENALYANTLASLILRQDVPSREDLVFIMASGANQTYKIQAYQKLTQIEEYFLPTEAEIIKNSQNIKNVTKVRLANVDPLDIEAAMRRVIGEGGNLAQMVGTDQSVLLEGVTEEDLLNIKKSKIAASLYDTSRIEGFLKQMTTSITSNGHTKYSGLLPIYLRLKNRTLSKEPRLYFVLNKGQKFVVPRGFVLAIDEKGQLKFVPKDSEASIYNSSRSWFKFMDKSLNLLRKSTDKRKHVVFEQALSQAELAGLARVLSADMSNSKVGVVQVRQQDSFEALMLAVALVAGADLGASMAGEFKMMFEDWASVAILISGFGYLSPKLANLFNPLIAKHGHYKTVKTVLLTMVGISILGMAGGLLGNFSLKDANWFGETVSYLFAPVAILMASILSTISSPIMKSAYKDSTQYAAKNLAFTTTKGLSRAGVTLLPWFLGAVIGIFCEQELNWSILVPVMLGVSLYGFHLLQKSRLAVDSVEEKKANPISKKEAKQIYNRIFKPQLASTVSRVALVYLTYAAVNSVILSGEMKMLYPAYGLLITSIGLTLSYAVRKIADKMIKNKVITDDQLTGIGLPIMLFGIASYLYSPAGSFGMWLSWVAMYLSTPVFGVVENSRMMNKVAQHYEAERSAIRKNKDLSDKKKKEEIELSKKTEEVVKLQAAGAYNSANSKGLYSILILTALFLFLKDIPEIRTMAQPYMDAIKNFFGDPTLTSKGEFTNDYVIYRLGALLSIFTGSILMFHNWGMIKDGWSRLLRSTALSQKTIDSYVKGELEAQKVYDSLRFDTNAVPSNLSRIKSEVNALQTSLLGSLGALESEPRLQKLLNRLVWANNRMKASMEGSKVPEQQLAVDLQALRASANMLENILEFNDVSAGLRSQAEAFINSVRSIRFEEDETVQILADSLREYAPKVKNGVEFMEMMSSMEESYAHGNLKRFEVLYSSIIKMLKDVEITQDGKIKELYEAAVKTMDNGTYTVQNVNLNYLPEVKMSLLAHMPGLGKEARSIFDGTDVSDYERVKVGYLRTLKILLENKTNGQWYDGMNGDFALYYQKAIETLNRYAAGTNDSERVQSLRDELNEVYTQYMGEAPTEEAVTAQAEQNSGLWDLLTKWWKTVFSLLKGGDSSGNSGPAAPADGPNLD